MISPRVILAASLAASGIVVSGLHAEEQSGILCEKSQFLAPPDSAEHRKYAPDREIDILNLALDITPDFKRRSIAGQATIRFKPIAKPVAELQLDAVDLRISSVTGSETVQNYQSTDKKLIINFAQPIAADHEATLVIAYAAEPVRGLYFRTPEMGYKDGDTHLFTQGEAIEARHWYPCFDAPNEKFTSEITCRVPEGMTVLSNGRLLSEEKDAASGLRVAHWQQDKPHSNYLISLLAGYFKKLEDTYNNIPLAFYTPASQINEAATSFRDTKDAMAYFEREIGVPYPWAKYYQVCVNDFVAGGMENTSITTLTDQTLFTEQTENIRSSEGLVAHELAHQWFGDLVTCKDWSHLWLNEGFATYYALLYDGYKNGRDAMLLGLYYNAKGIIERTDDTKPIVYRRYDDPNEQFSYLAYPKGGWVLHMLRSQLGEDLYRRCIKTYLDRHQYDSVVTDDLNDVIEQLSGRSYDRFFDQWVYHAHHPELEVIYRWDEGAKLARLSISQNQKLSDDVLLFQFPLTVRFKTAAGAIDRQIRVRQKAEDFYFALPKAPRLVRIDPEFALLAKIKFVVPEPMLREQLQDKSDVIGRLLAVEQLRGKVDHASVEMLKTCLKEDAFYGVRVEASRALRAIHTDEAAAALLESLEQKDARVRHEVMQAATSFYGNSSYELASRQLEREKNPDIASALLRSLGAYPKAEVQSKLIAFLNSESYRNSLAEAAVAGMRAQSDPAYIQPLQKALRGNEAKFTGSGFGRGLDALAFLSRNENDKEAVREFLVSFVSSRRRVVQLAALRALGTLGDPKAMAVLETFSSARKESPEREAADKALAELRSGQKPADEWRDLRQEVLELKNANREMKKELEALQKRVDVPAKAVKDKSRKKEAKTE